MAYAYHSPDNPIYEHFSRGRRDWWRSRWWLAALSAFLAVVPALNAVMVTFFLSVYHTYVPPRVYVFGVLSGRLFIPAALVLIIMSIVNSAAAHRLPPELVLTCSAPEANRAFQRSLRRTAYLFAAILVLPLLVIIGLDCLYPPSYLLVGEFPFAAFCWSAVYLAGTGFLVAESLIMLELRWRRLPQLLHLLAPLMLIGVFCLVGPSPEEIDVPLEPFAEQVLRMPEPLAAIAWGVCLGALAVVIYRTNSQVPVKADHWRAG